MTAASTPRLAAEEGVDGGGDFLCLRRRVWLRLASACTSHASMGFSVRCAPAPRPSHPPWVFFADAEGDNRQHMPYGPAY
jgi:hypothetical protein